MDLESLMSVLDHHELIHWIQYSSFRAAEIGQTTINFDEREFITLSSGKKVKITIKVEEII